MRNFVKKADCLSGRTGLLLLLITITPQLVACEIRAKLTVDFGSDN